MESSVRKIEKLYIYEIAGTVTARSGDLATSFLGSWCEGEFSYLFFSECAGEVIEQILERNPHCRLVSKTEMDYDQWEPADALKPFEIPPLSFLPAWMEGATDSMTILLDPGVVFGAGTHHTTRSCLELLVFLMKSEHISRVIDLGTGTGILALAAARMGATDVIAVDNNSLAVETAERNSALNHLEDRIRCVQGDAVDYREVEADLTLANLILSELQRMFVPGAQFCSRWYILSGLNGTEVRTFRDSIQGLPFRVVQQVMDNLWFTLLLEQVQFS